MEYGQTGKVENQQQEEIAFFSLCERPDFIL